MIVAYRKRVGICVQHVGEIITCISGVEVEKRP